MPGTPSAAARRGLGGLIVIRQDDPVRSARALARELDVLVAIGGERVAKAVASWPALRTDSKSGFAVDLDHLGERTRRAEGVVSRTRQRATNELTRSLHSALAVHSSTLRRAAHNYLAAVKAHQDPVSIAPPRKWLPLASLPLAVAASVAAVAAGVGVLGVALGSLLVITAGVIYLGDRARSQASIADLAAMVELTRRRWEALAGAGADPHDIDAVARRFDPQADLVAVLVELSPAVRAAERALLDNRIAWVRGWRDTLEQPVSVEAALIDPEVLESIRQLVAKSDSDAVVIMADPYSNLDRPQANTVYRELANVPTGIVVVVVLGSGETSGLGRSWASRWSKAPPPPPAVPRGPLIDLTAVEAIFPGAPGTVLEDRSRSHQKADRTR